MPRQIARNVWINTTQKTQKYLNLRPRNFPIYVQFGKGKKKKKRPRVVINYVHALKKIRNKQRTHEEISGLGVPKPRYIPNYRTAERLMRRHDMTIVAKRKKLSRARGIEKIESLEELQSKPKLQTSKYYFEEFVDANREWRIHISRWHDEEIVAYRKCLLGDVVEQIRENDEPKPWVRNIQNCYYKLNSDEDKENWWDDIIADCKKVAEHLKIDVCSFDVGENNKGDEGQWWIYEVNSASAMEEVTRENYERVIEQIVNKKAKRKGLI